MITLALIIIRLFNPFKYSLYECNLENGVSVLFTGDKEQVGAIGELLTKKHFEHLAQATQPHLLDLTKPQ